MVTAVLCKLPRLVVEKPFGHDRASALLEYFPEQAIFRIDQVKIFVAFGYAGWGPDQLEREIEERFWGTAEADPTLVFDEDRENVWDDAWKHRTQHL